MKVCIKCNINKAIECYPKTGRGYISGECKICKAQYKKIWKKDNSEKVTIINKKWKEDNKDHCSNLNKEFYNKNKLDNDFKEKRKQYNSAFHKSNPHISKNAAAKRRAKTKAATIGNYREELLDIYKNCPIGYHVDHIIPLNSNIVSGLHVPWNLQYLTADDNLSKGNRLLIK